ncbi:unnamed protein product [Boreogadus saida]
MLHGWSAGGPVSPMRLSKSGPAPANRISPLRDLQKRPPGAERGDMFTSRSLGGRRGQTAAQTAAAVAAAARSGQMGPGACDPGGTVGQRWTAAASSSPLTTRSWAVQRPEWATTTEGV